MKIRMSSFLYFACYINVFYCVHCLNVGENINHIKSLATCLMERATSVSHVLT